MYRITIIGIVAESDRREQQRASRRGIARAADEAVGEAVDDADHTADGEVGEYAAIYESWIEGIDRGGYQPASVDGARGELPVELGPDEQSDYGARAGGRERRMGAQADAVDEQRCVEKTGPGSA